jgi:hypothetical protein
MLTCDYCDQPATRHLIEGDEVLCRACTLDHFAKPAEWTRVLTPHKITKIIAARAA